MSSTELRVLPSDLEEEIVAEQYYVFPGTTVTVCCLTLRNGFTVTGEAACVMPENFDAALGERLARRRAVERLWPLLGFALRDAVNEAATKRAPRYRCAESGEYVTRGYAEDNPRTTVREA